MSKILKGLNEVNPHNYDSDWDYQDAVAKSGKSRSSYRSQEDDTSDADIAYSKKMYQLSQKQKRDADHDRLATGTNEGLDDPWGDQGNFAGDKPVNIGGDTVKQLQVGDIVTYFGQKARIEAMSKTGNTSRITIANKMGGTTQDVLTRDLKRTGVAEEIGGVGGGFGTNYPGTYEEENGPFTHKGGLKLTSLTTESVDYLDEK